MWVEVIGDEFGVLRRLLNVGFIKLELMILRILIRIIAVVVIKSEIFWLMLLLFVYYLIKRFVIDKC